MMKCSFCKKEIEQGRGLMFVKNDGSIFYFCSSKCWKNFKLGRDPSRVKWAKTQERR